MPKSAIKLPWPIRAMPSRLLMCCFVCATVFAYGASARAELMHTSASLRPGQLSLGVEVQAGLVSGSPLSLNLHEAFGLANGLDLYLRQGLFFSDNVWYLGGGLKWTIHASRGRGSPGMALLFGGHALIGGGGAGGDATFIVDLPLGRFRPFLAVDANLEFRSNDLELLLGLIPGLRYALSKQVHLNVEWGIGLIGTPKPHLLSAGLIVII